MTFPRKTVFQGWRKINDPIDTEAGIYSRVQGTGGQACEGRPVGWGGSQGLEADRTDATQLGESPWRLNISRCFTTESGCTRRWATTHRCSSWANGSLLSNRGNW